MNDPDYSDYERINDLIAENADLRRQLAEAHEELKLWRPLTPAEAQAAFEAAEAIPLSEEEAERIVKRVTDPAERLNNLEEAQLHVRVNKLTQQLAEAQRQRDEAQAACAAMRSVVEEVAGAALSFSDARVRYVEMQLSPRIQEEAKAAMSSTAGRDFLARLEAAQRTAQAADGLAKAIEEMQSNCDCQSTIHEPCANCQRAEDALAAYQATKEQK